MSAPVDTTSFPGRLANNPLCGRMGSLTGRGNYTAKGITKLCEGLKGSAVTSLKYAAPQRSNLCQCPLTLLTIPAPPSVHSLEDNWLGPEGGAALAEGLKGNSMLQVLKWAN